MFARVEELAPRRISFGFETTLASRSFAPWFRLRRSCPGEARSSNPRPSVLVLPFGDLDNPNGNHPVAVLVNDRSRNPTHPGTLLLRAFAVGTG